MKIKYKHTMYQAMCTCGFCVETKNKNEFKSAIENHEQIENVCMFMLISENKISACSYDKAKGE